MRIAHLVWGGELVGSQLVALEIARASRAAGHVVTFVAPARDAFTDRAEGEGFPVDVVVLGSALDPRSLWRLRRLLRRRRIDVLHTHVLFTLNLLGRLAARSAGASVVAHMHNVNAYRAGRGRSLQIALDNLTARLCAAIVAVSESTRRSIIEQGYPASRITVIPNGIEVGRPSEQHRPDGVPRDAPVLLQVARLTPVKGQLQLIRALARMEDRKAVAVLVGEDVEMRGAYQAELEREIVGLSLVGRVMFTGRRDDVPELIAGADLVVLPSFIEGMPLVVLEAMAAGVPVVATRAGGTPELVRDGVTGLLVDPGDVDALAQTLDELLADRARAQALGEAGRRRAESEFSLDRTMERILRVYPTR